MKKETAHLDEILKEQQELNKDVDAVNEQLKKGIAIEPQYLKELLIRANRLDKKRKG